MKLNQYEQKEFDQNLINVKLFLFFNFYKIYTIQNFKKIKIFWQSSLSVIDKKFEKKNFITKISFHIRYDKLLKNVINVIKIKFFVKQIQIQNVSVILFYFIKQVFIKFKIIKLYINFLCLFRKIAKHFVFVTSNFLFIFRKKFRISQSFFKWILFSSSEFSNKKIRIAKNSSAAKFAVKKNRNSDNLLSIK